MTGLQAAREISRTHPHVRILILSMYDNEQYFFEALKAGASGYVLNPWPTATCSRHAGQRCGANHSYIPVRSPR